MQSLQIDNRTIFRILISIAAFLLAIKVIVLLRTELLWIGAAFFLTVALNPAVSALSRRLPRRSRGLAIILVLLVSLLVLGFLVYSFVPPLLQQTDALVKAAPGYLHEVQHLRGPFGDFVRRYHLASQISGASQTATHYISQATGSAAGILHSVFSGLAALFAITALTFFMLLEAPQWSGYFWALSSPHHRQRNQHIATQMYQAVTGYVNGNLFTSLIAAVSSAIMMTILGVGYAIPLGLIVGILDLIPMVGATLAAIIVVAVALFHSFSSALIMAIFFVVYQQIENHILQPLVYGASTELSPLVVTVAILLGTALAGIFGALVAIPIAGCIKVILLHYYGPRLRSAAK